MGKRKTRRSAEFAESHADSQAKKNGSILNGSDRLRNSVMIGVVLLVAALFATSYLMTSRPPHGSVDNHEAALKLSRQPPQILKVIRPPNRLPETKLGPAITSDGISIQQSYLTCPKGRIILDHFPVGYAQISGMPDAGHGEVKETYFVAGEPWYQGVDSGFVLTTFNCFTFAIAPFIGLTPNDRLEAAVTPGFGNPLELALESYFVKIETFDFDSNFRSEQFDANIELRDGDVFCLVKKQYGEVSYVHAGRIKKVYGVNRLISKFGRMGPIVLTNWKYIFRHYEGNEIRIFRFDPVTRRGSTP